MFVREWSRLTWEVRKKELICGKEATTKANHLSGMLSATILVISLTSGVLDTQWYPRTVVGCRNIAVM